MIRASLQVLAGVALIASAASAAAAAPAVEAGHYHGRTTADASGKPRAIAFTVKTTGCGTAAYCVAVDPESYIQGKCATSGYMYNAFFPIAAPIALPPSGKLDRTYTLYVGSNGAIRVVPGGGGVPSGKFQLSLVFDGQGRVTGSERVSVDLHEGDGVCDTGAVKITASR